jgi:Ca2+-transporting ATPase
MSVAELAADGQRAVLPAGVPLPPPLAALLACADGARPDQPVDPMEVAIREALASAPTAEQRDGWSRIREYPLSRELLVVAHAWQAPGAAAPRVYCKGAPEAVAGLCGLDAAQRDAVLDEVAAMARRGLRVIAAAAAEWPGDPALLPVDPRGFAFEWRGLVALADPLRAGAADAVAEARGAGVRVIMLTGDHLETARAIAAQAGIPRPDNVVLGGALEAADAGALRTLARDTDVFARVKPEHKLALVEALRHDGEVVAMTGDGVNDAPALLAAHVGVAMGARGTDVAREAASIVLLDDDFVTVVKAIRHGRVIYDNIVRAVRYILAVHVPITGLALLPLLFGGPLVLLPLHVVFLEMIIDPASTLVFEREPAAPDVMRRAPRAPSRRLLDARTLFGSLAQGLVVFAAVAGVYVLGRAQALPAPELAAASFIALVTGNLGLIVANRAGAAERRWWRQSNAAFWIVSGSALALLFAITQFALPASWFRFATPPPAVSVVAVLLPLVALALVETAVGLWRRRMRADTQRPR